MKALVVEEVIEKRIFLIRNHKVMLDRDLAGLYGVSTKVLNQAVKRNKKRFPSDCMFKLTKPEKDELVTICDRFKTLKHSSVSPHAFSEQGVAMLSSNSGDMHLIIDFRDSFVKIKTWEEPRE